MATEQNSRRQVFGDVIERNIGWKAGLQRKCERPLLAT